MKTHPDALALANELMNARDIESINICQRVVAERLALIAERDDLRAENERLRAIVDAAHAACQAEHMGARLACGQCHDSNRQHLDNARARVGVLRGVLASWMGHAMHSQEERKQAEAVLAETEGKQ